MDVTDRQLLELAGRTYLGAGSRENAIHDELGLAANVFWARVSRLVDAPPLALAVEFAPTIARLRRIREAGQRQRMARRG